MTTGWIKEADNLWDRVALIDAKSAPMLSSSCLSDALGRQVESCRILSCNLRNRIYRISFPNGREAIAKQACVGESHELETEFSALVSLLQFSLGQSIGIPLPITYLPDQRVYLMEFVSGTPLDALIRGGRAREVIDACALAGKALGAIHDQWTHEIREIPLHELNEDLAHISLRLAVQEKQALAAATEMLHGQVIPIGQPYLDYKPANIVYDHGRIWLIDPPEQRRQSEMLWWDVAVFRRGLRHEFCKSFPRWRSRNARKAIDAFEQAYHTATTFRFPRELFGVLVDLLELQRLGQLIALQKGKCRGARRCLAGRRSVSTIFTNVARFAAPLPVLRMQAHRVLKRLNSSLS